MKKLKALREKYITKKLSLQMEIDYLSEHNYAYESQWKIFELSILLETIKDVENCLNGSEKETKK